MRGHLRAGLLFTALGACQTQGSELGGLAELPPLDCSVLVTGGAYLTPHPGRRGTFGSAAETGEPYEAIGVDAVVDVLRRGSVFQHVAVDEDAGRRRLVREQLRLGSVSAPVLAVLQKARDDGFDFLLVVEELQDGPIDVQGTNGRWPVTFATWILLGIGALIPDQTFESRATLRVTLREVQTGKVLHDPLLVSGPVELALVERSDVLGLLESIVVPPFFVGDDPERVAAAVRGVTERRLLLSLARDLKSESVRQRLRERSAARLVLVGTDGGSKIVVDCAESLSSARLRGGSGIQPSATAAFERDLLASRTWDGEYFHYEAMLPEGAAGRRLQVLVGTIRGSVASATFLPGAPR